MRGESGAAATERNGIAPAADIVFVRVTRGRSDGIENDDLVRAVEASLRRLATDRIDLFYLHRFDDAAREILTSDPADVIALRDHADFRDAVAIARRGIYAAAALKGLPAGVRDRHFGEAEGGFQVAKRLRALMVFGEHDLGERAPFPRIDLLLCRNVLI